MKTLIFAFFAFSLVPQLGCGQNVPPDMLHRFKLKELTTKTGLSQNTVWDLFQDQQGFIWFATGDGLDRYDGQKFKHYLPDPDNKNSLSSSYVRKIYQAKNGMLWFGTSDKGLDRFNPRTGVFTHYRHKKNVPGTLTHNTIQSINEDHLGNLWVGTPKGLNKLSSDKSNPDSILIQSFLSEPNNSQSLCHSDVLTINKSIDGNLWIGTKNGLNKLLIDKKGGIRFERYLITLPAYKNFNYIEAIFEDKQQRLWLGGPYGVGVLNYKTKVFTPYLAGKQRVTTRHIYQDSKEVVWVATYKGMYWFDKRRNAFIHFRNDNQVLQNIYNTGVMRILEDRSGGLWAGTIGNGVYMIDRKSQKFTLHSPSLTDSSGRQIPISYWHLLYDQKKLWLRTLNDKLAKFDPVTNEIVEYKHDKADLHSLSNPRVRTIYKDQQNNIWVGTRNGLNLFLRKENHFRRYYPAKEVKNRINDIFEDALGNLLVNVSGKWLYKFNPGTNTFEKYIKLPQNKGRRKSINTISIDKDHVLWLGTLKGLVLLNTKTSETQLYDKSSGLKSNSVLDIYISKTRDTWLTTYGGGLSKVIRHKNGHLTFRHYGKVQGLLNEFVYSIQEDTQGNLWMSHEKGISRFDPTTEKFTNYSIIDGIQDGEFNQDSFTKSNTGQLFFGGTKGINAFYPERIVKNDYLPPVILTNFQIFNETPQMNTVFKETVNYAKKIVLTYAEAKAFSFEFAALNYINTTHNQYKVKLEGYDKKWHNLHIRNFMSYTNIPPDKYTFKVQASNNDGVWNTRYLEVEVVILPAWWQTWWFKTTWISMLVLLVVGIYRLRVNTIKRQKRVLEEKVVLRTREVVAQKEEIHKQKEEISQRNASITAQNEELQQQQEEIMAQRDAIEQQNNALSTQNRHIQQSIKSAKTIQEAILPFEVRMRKILGEYFVIYRPRDIVSGDFYWLGQVEDKRIVAVIDCTGHGVPGAFMSMVGFTILNEIINTKQITNAATILEELRDYVRYALRQDETGGRNGMDAALITLEEAEDDQARVCFAGAKRPLWYIQKGDTETQVVRGSSVSIGIIYDGKREINNVELTCPKDTLIYLSSDGFADQNDMARRKIGNLKLKQLLYQYHSLSMGKQKQALEEVLNQHMIGTEQRDDILLLGLKV